jgi:hypothetical protein
MSNQQTTITVRRIRQNTLYGWRWAWAVSHDRHTSYVDSGQVAKFLARKWAAMYGCPVQYLQPQK